MEQLIESLKKVPMLAALRKEQIEGLAKLATIKDYVRNEVVIKQGDPGTALYVILTGTVKVTQRNRPGFADTTLNVLGKGEFFGEMSLIDGYPRAATVTAQTDTQTVELNRWAFLDALKREPAIAVAMLPVLTRRIRQLEESKVPR